jgi:hypothetical protein
MELNSWSSPQMQPQAAGNPGMDTTPNRSPDGAKGPTNDDVTFFETGSPSTTPLRQFKEPLHECP